MEQRLWPDGPILYQSPDVFPLSTDSILLADFARPGPRDRVLDLGTGSGVLPVLLTFERPELTVTGIELSSPACALFRRNIQSNGLENRVTLLQGDLREPGAIPNGVFDLTLSNPPYYSESSGAVADGDMGQARSDLSCTLSQLCMTAARATRWGGRFCLVFPPDRLCDLISSLRDSGFEPKRLRPVHHSPGKAANLILLEARRGGKPGLRWEPDLYLHDTGGAESAETRRIYHRIKE